jgi:hypothetical protein
MGEQTSTPMKVRQAANISNNTPHLPLVCAVTEASPCLNESPVTSFCSYPPHARNVPLPTGFIASDLNS